MSTTIAVCDDCACLIANGEVFSSTGEDLTYTHGTMIDNVWGGIDLTLGHYHQGEECPDCYCEETPGQTCEDFDYECDHGWFSWSSCEGCESPLGGTRHYATAWIGE